MDEQPSNREDFIRFASQVGMQTEARKSQQKELGLRLRLIRECTRLTQKEAAEALGLDRATVTMIELGQRRVDVFELLAFCRLYHVKLASLLTGFKGRLVGDEKRKEEQDSLDLA